MFRQLQTLRDIPAKAEEEITSAEAMVRNKTTLVNCVIDIKLRLYVIYINNETVVKSVLFSKVHTSFCGTLYGTVVTLVRLVIKLFVSLSSFVESPSYFCVSTLASFYKTDEAKFVMT